MMRLTKINPLLLIPVHLLLIFIIESTYNKNIITICKVLFTINIFGFFALTLIRAIRYRPEHDHLIIPESFNYIRINSVATRMAAEASQAVDGVEGTNGNTLHFE